jgi:hypothetical protein
MYLTVVNVAVPPNAVAKFIKSGYNQTEII